MAEQSAPSSPSKRYAKAFIGGTVALLFASLLLTGVWFTASFVSRERERGEAFRKQTIAAFEYEYKLLSEETWTQNYESVRYRIARLTSSLGARRGRVILWSPAGTCLYAATSAEESDLCGATTPDASPASSFGTIVNPTLVFDEHDSNYIYKVRLEIGPEHLANMTVVFDDPNNLLIGQHGIIAFSLRSLAWPLGIVLVVWMLWLVFVRRYIAAPYLKGIVTLERNAALSSTARQVAHDIRSPLIVIERLLDSVGVKDPHAARLLNQAAQRIKKIAADLTERSRGRPTGFGATSGASRVRLDDVLTEVVQEKAVESAGHSLNLVWRNAAARQQAFVTVVLDDFKRVCSNLLNNAIEASPNGGNITIEVGAVDQDVIIDIVDRGVGMPAHVLQWLGKGEVTSAKAQGSGLGFLHARQVVEASHGMISVTSVVGEGTRVRMQLPNTAGSVLTVVGDNVNVALLIDDDPWVHDAWTKAAREQGCDLATIAGPQALSPQLLARLRRDTPIFVDVELGLDVSGTDVARQLIKKGFKRVFLATAHAADDIPGLNELTGLAGVIGKEPPVALFSPRTINLQT